MKTCAEQYNDIGWVVMPICPNSKIPILKEWTKIKNNNETLDYFKDDSNIGIIMGSASGIICIDVDVKKHNGIDTLNSLEDQLGTLPRTVTSETPSGGIHYYFKYHEGIRNRKNVGKGIDIQGNGTQTVESPSVIDGIEYEWICDPFETDVAELPEAWIKYLCEEDDDNLVLSNPPFVAPKEIEEGSRNNTITKFVASLLGKNKLKKKTIITKTLKYNQESCEPPLEEKEIMTIIESMIKTDITNKSNNIKNAIKKDEDKDEDLPPWMKFDETGVPYIDEKAFAEWYVEKNQIHCVNGRFFSKYGLINDGWFENNIHNIIGSIIKVGLARRVSELLKVVKNECYIEVGCPDPYKIKFDNCAFDTRSGKLVPCDDFFTLHQLPHNYDENAKCPHWEKFINELFYEEDIKVVQEYLGYCLIPSTLAQTSLFITGEGGEGKSRITIMLEHILGANSVVIGDFKGLQEKFSMVSLDNQMLFIDDDLSSDALDDTSNFKKIVTAETLLEVEPKGKAKYKTNLYTKILCCGNSAVTSKFDRSDGFYRRLLVTKVRTVNKNRTPDRQLIDKLKNETPGIINWMLEGLLRVVNNGFVISGSIRMKSYLQEIRNNSDTITLFLADNQYIECTLDDKNRVSMKQIYETYENWCNDNGYICIHKTTFGKVVRKNYKQLLLLMYEDKPKDVEYISNVDRVYINNKQVRGFVGLKILNYKKSFTVNQ